MILPARQNPHHHHHHQQVYIHYTIGSQLLLSSAVVEVGVWTVSVVQTRPMCALLPHLQG